MTSSTLERFQEFRTFDPTILGFQNSRISLKINGGERGFERSILGSEPDPPKLIEGSQLVDAVASRSWKAVAIYRSWRFCPPFRFGSEETANLVTPDRTLGLKKTILAISDKPPNTLI